VRKSQSATSSRRFIGSFSSRSSARQALALVSCSLTTLPAEVQQENLLGDGEAPAVEQERRDGDQRRRVNLGLQGGGNHAAPPGRWRCSAAISTATAYLNSISCLSISAAPAPCRRSSDTRASTTRFQCRSRASAFFLEVRANAVATIFLRRRHSGKGVTMASGASGRGAREARPSPKSKVS
jgi:hypothetical protein